MGTTEPNKTYTITAVPDTASPSGWRAVWTGPSEQSELGRTSEPLVANAPRFQERERHLERLELIAAQKAQEEAEDRRRQPWTIAYFLLMFGVVAYLFVDYRTGGLSSLAFGFRLTMVLVAGLLVIAVKGSQLGRAIAGLVTAGLIGIGILFLLGKALTNDGIGRKYDKYEDGYLDRPVCHRC